MKRKSECPDFYTVYQDRMNIFDDPLKLLSKEEAEELACKFAKQFPHAKWFVMRSDSQFTASVQVTRSDRSK